MVLRNVINFFSTDIFLPLKKFVLDKHVVADRPFKIATKYTGALLAVFMCSTATMKITCDGMPKYKRDYANTFCYNQDTFLVARCLQPNMSNITYPGVCPYNDEKDEIIRISYYKQLNLILFILMAIVFGPHFFWKVAVTRRIVPLVTLKTGEEIADQFLQSKGMNAFLGILYLLYKIVIVALPALQYYFLCANLGSGFYLYGYDVIMLLFKPTWPNPKDVLFPKMAKCAITVWGFSGDPEKLQLLCQLNANIIMQWCFLVYWFWIGFVLIVSVMSWMYTFCNWIYSCNKPIKMSFGDWVLMRFIEMNLSLSKYTAFIKHLQSTKNVEVTTEHKVEESTKKIEVTTEHRVEENV